MNAREPFRLTLFISLFFVPFFLSAQSPYLKQSRYGLLYPLKPGRVEQLMAKNPGRLSLSELESLLDTVPFTNTSLDQADLHPGHYLKATVVRSLIRYSWIQKPSIGIRAISQGDQVLLSLAPFEKGEEVRAQVYFKEKELAYDPQWEGYWVPKAKKSGRIKVKQADEVWYFHYSGARRNGNKVFYAPGDHLGALTWYYYKRGSKSGGYLVTNQPEYRPGDTLKLKGYFVNKKGKPVEDQLYLTLQQSGYPYKVIFTDSLKPKVPGAYLYEYKLPDSLKLDLQYRVFLGKKKKLSLGSAMFYFRDYELDEVTYAAHLDKQSFEDWEPVEISASGKEAGGLTVADARVKMTLKNLDVWDWKLKSSFVPKILWEGQQLLEPEGETRIILPDSIFPDAYARYSLKLVFNNSNNETQDTLLFFERNLGKQKIVAEVDSTGKIRFDLMDKGEIQEGWGRVVRVYAQKLTDGQTESPFPIYEEIDPMVQTYAVIVEEDTHYVSPKGLNAGVSIKGESRRDSVYYSVKNPYDLDLAWEITRGKKIVATGMGKQLEWSGAHKGNNAYQLRVLYQWKGRSQSISENLARLEKQLHFEVEQKEKVYPGEQTKITVRVKDYLGNPVQNVNMAAWAVNDQFDNQIIPSIPYLGVRQKLKSGNRQQATQIREGNYSQQLLKRHLPAFDLDTARYYQRVFADSGLAYFYQDIEGSRSEFAPHVVKNGYKMDVYLIYVDGTPVYYARSNGQESFSFKVSAGKHEVRLRTWSSWITIPKVEMRPGKKLDLVLDLSRQPTQVEIEKAKSGELDKKEQKRLHPYLIYGDYITQYQNKAYLLHHGTVFDLKQNYNSGWCLGPFSYGQVHYRELGQDPVDFSFEAGYRYEIHNRTIKMHPQKKFPKELRGLGYLDDQPFGEIGMRWKDINWQKPYAYFFSDPLKYQGPWRSSILLVPSQSGTLKFKVETDSTIHYQVLFRAGDTRNFWFNDGSVTTWPGMYKGTYHLFFVTKAGNYFMETVRFDTSGTWLYTYKPDNWIPAGDMEQVFRASVNRVNGPKGDHSYRNIARAFGPAQIEGQILDEQGNPISMAGLEVELNSSRMEYSFMHAETDEKGKFKFHDIGERVYWVRVYGPENQEGLAFVDTRQDSGLYRVNLTLRDSAEAWKIYRETLRDKNVGYDPYSFEMQKLSLDHLGLVTGGTPAEYGDDITLNLEGGNTQYLMYTSNRDIVETTVSVRGSRKPSPGVFKIGKGTGFYAPRKLKSTGKMSSKAGVLYDENTDLLTEFDQDKREEREKMLFENGLKARWDFGDASGLRTRFADHAYWVPLVLSDEKGEATFEVTYPDNVTSWKGWMVGMDEEKHSGKVSTLTQAYKPVMARLSLPRFLIEGDEAVGIGKAQNLTDSLYQVKTSYKLNNEMKSQQSVDLERIQTEELPLSAKGLDSLTAEYTLEVPAEDFLDGEQRIVPVFRQGTEEAQGRFLALEEDTTFAYTFPPGLEQKQVYVQFDLLDVFLEEIEKLENYPHQCNEQIASKLKATLAREKIYETLDRPFEDKKEVRKLIRKLKRNQQSEGGWAWWSKGDQGLWMTAYVTQTLHEAEKMGYDVGNAVNKGQGYLSASATRSRWPSVQLSAYVMMAEMEMKVDYQHFFASNRPAERNLYERFQWVRLQQLTGAKYDTSWVRSSLQETWTGGAYPAGWGLSTFERSIPLSLLAYKILSQEGDSANIRKIRRHLLRERSHRGWQNTLQSATILSTLLPDLVREQGKNVLDPPVVILKNQAGEIILRTDSTTRINLLDEAKSFSVEKKGYGPVYFTAYGRQWNPNPLPLDSLFRVTSSLEKDGKVVDSLTGGEAAQLIIKVESPASYEYLMIEVPIPAGCSYGNNVDAPNSLEAHREYKKDKTYIYLESLPTGTYTFKINLEPRFEGSYTLNPAKIENMYFPTLAGRNGMKKVKITGRGPE